MSKPKHTPSENAREYYVAKVYRKLGKHKQLAERWAKIGYTPPKYLQLELF